MVEADDRCVTHPTTPATSAGSDVEVLKFDKYGLGYHVPPFSAEEEADFDRRTARAAAGKNSPRCAAANKALKAAYWRPNIGS
jgi:hypothetical protein